MLSKKMLSFLTIKAFFLYKNNMFEFMRRTIFTDFRKKSYSKNANTHLDFLQ